MHPMHLYIHPMHPSVAYGNGLWHMVYGVWRALCIDRSSDPRGSRGVLHR